MSWVSVIVGLGLLVYGGDALVKGAVGLALRLGIPALIVGLTVVAFGTSAPELIVSVLAAYRGQAEIALGNVVGSNIVNILLILGLPALIVTIRSSQTDTARSYLIMLATTVLFIALCFAGPLRWWHGMILIAGLCLTLWDNIRIARAHQGSAAKDEVEVVDPVLSSGRIAFFIIVGLITLAIGARLLVGGATDIARGFGVSETVIGLTLVAIGTSLPELVTSIISAIRGQADVAMGNVIGSNTLNILAILGIASLVSPMPVPQVVLNYDLWVMLGVSLLLAPFVLWKLDITRFVGIGLIAVYVAYAVTLVA